MSQKIQPDNGVELILTGGRIITMDATAPAAEAIAIQGGEIAAVGTNDEISALAGKETETIDVGGLTVIPGFNDTHAHMDREGLKAQRPSLEGAESIGDILRHSRYDGGDHEIIMGRVLEIHGGNTDRQPLVVAKGRYQRLAGGGDPTPLGDATLLYGW